MSDTASQLIQEFAACSAKTLDECCQKIHHCVEQLDDEQLWWRGDEQQNSVANLMLHLAGNVTQWIVSGVGGEPDERNRPGEFEAREGDRETIATRLDEAVNAAKAVFNRLEPADLLDNRRIQGNDNSGMKAIIHSVSHFEGHTHQIIYITRRILGGGYRFHWEPSTPEEKSAS